MSPPSPTNPFDFDPSRPWPAGAGRTVALGEAGLLLGAGTVLAPFAGGVAKGAGHLAVDPGRVLALLSVAAGRPVDAARALAGVEAAAGHWARGDRARANMRLLFAGLPRLATPLDAERLRVAAWLLDGGMTLRRLMEDLGLEAASLDAAIADHLAKYDPDQPRVPAGNGPASGRWIGADGAFGLTGRRGRLLVSQLRFDTIQVAANGPLTPAGTAENFDPGLAALLDPKQIGTRPTPEEQEKIIDALNTIITGRGRKLRQLSEGDYENYPHPETGAHLPNSSGNYKEYTVRTPGIFDRGERRLVIDWSKGEVYYTSNHYRNFSHIIIMIPP